MTTKKKTFWSGQNTTLTHCGTMNSTQQEPPGRLLEKELSLEINVLECGPLGGEQQIGARIADGDIDFLIFFWDPLTQQPHDPDVKALLRVAVVWNIPIACNRSSADFMISSSLMCQDYPRKMPDYEGYRQRLNHK